MDVNQHHAPGIPITALDLAERFVGMREVPGSLHNPAVLAMLRLDQSWPQADEVPWCGAFANWIAWLLELPRSRDLRARSWLRVGDEIKLTQARAGFDVVIFKRGKAPQPGPDVIAAPGHVAFFERAGGGRVHVIGGNQGDAVTRAAFPIGDVLGVRRLHG